MQFYKDTGLFGSQQSQHTADRAEQRLILGQETHAVPLCLKSRGFSPSFLCAFRTFCNAVFLPLNPTFAPSFDTRAYTKRLTHFVVCKLNCSFIHQTSVQLGGRNDVSTNMIKHACFADRRCNKVMFFESFIGSMFACHTSVSLL